jgi:signal transduction histidine kinase/DNA-binding response OmpR family regulator
MSNSQERILLVEGDPDISDLISRQALRPLGYQVRVVGDATLAIRAAIQISPDVVIVNMDLPGLSGKDLLVALSSQKINCPVIVIAEEGMEGDVIQAFRLGASDYLTWPVREAEVVSAVERALGQVRARHERERLSQQLEKTNTELQRRVRELTTLFGIGKAVTSVTDQRMLFDKLISGGVSVAGADKGWLLLRHGEGKVFTLSACKNMPKSILKKIGQVWDDGISSLVALSGESLSIHGSPLKRFKVAQFGQSALVVPVKAQKEVIGLMIVMREAVNAFSPSNQTMLEAVADYASISLMNARLFEALERRAHSLQKAVEKAQESERVKASMLQNVAQELQTPLTGMEHQLDILTEDLELMRADHQSSVGILSENMKNLNRIVDAINGLQKESLPQKLKSVDLIELTRQALTHFDNAAEKDSVKLSMEFQNEPLLVRIDSELICQVFEVLLSNAIRYSAGGSVCVQISVGQNGMAHVMVKDSGPGIKPEHQEKIFQPFFQSETTSMYSHDGLGVGLSLAKDIIKSHGGEIWVKSNENNGSVFHFTLPPA